MSLILEALRRSEAERRRGQMPDLLAPGPVVRRNTRSSVIVPTLALVVGMALAAAVARWWWAAPATVSAPSAPPAPMAATVPMVRDVQRPIEAPAPSATRTSETPEAIRAHADQAVVTPSETPAVTAMSMEPRTPDALRMEVAMLGPNERAALPPLRISMHVFHDEPSRRFAIVDGQRLREGDVLTPGLRLQNIERDGLQLEWQGRALWLPR